MLRLGSAWYDVAAQIKAVTERGLDPRNFILCTDDCHSGTLVDEGHMDRVVRHAIAPGPEAGHRDPDGDPQHRAAFRAGARDRLDRARPARRFPARLRSAALPIETVIARGRVLARRRPARPPTFPPMTTRPGPRNGRLGQAARCRATSTSPRPPAPTRCRARVIGVIENQAPTRALEAELAGRGRAWSRWTGAGDVCQIALVERHRGTGGVVNAFVSGFGYRRIARWPRRSPMTATR